MKALLDNDYVFFDAAARLLPESELTASWQAYAEKIAPFVADGTIIALTPLDEPFAVARYYAGMPASVMKAQLETAATLIKKDFPNLPIALNESAYALDDSFEIPQGYDWIGFDCYGSLESCGIQSTVDLLKKKMTSTGKQRLFLIPDGVIFSSIPADSNEEDRSSRLDEYVKIAVNEPSIIGLFPFIWQSFAEGETTIRGVSDMAESVRQHFADVGRCISSVGN